jgi:hypothetical protein
MANSSSRKTRDGVAVKKRNRTRLDLLTLRRPPIISGNQLQVIVYK